MPLMVSESGTAFKPAPEGLHAAVCVDVVDLGVMENKFNPEKPQHKCRIVWQLEERDPENKDKRFIVARMYTISLNEKATLRKDLQSWRGRTFTPEELKGFDLEKLIGVNCQIQVIHHTNADGKTYGNVQSVVPLGKGMEKLINDGYVRVIDRPKDGQAQDADSAEDDDVPF